MGLPNIALIGYAGAGKDTAAAHLVSRYSYARVAFADPLKEMALRIDPLIGVNTRYDEPGGEPQGLSGLVSWFGWDYAKREYPEVRRFLQNLGAAMREDDPDYWLDKGLRSIDAAYDWNLPVVVSDCRYMNEYEELEARGFIFIRITRPGTGPVNEHVSESELAGAPTHYTLNNAGTPTDLADWFDRLLLHDTL